MATKEMLITALSQYDGTMLFVSHDRHFLAALSNRVLELMPRAFTSTAAATWITWRARAARLPACGAERPDVFDRVEFILAPQRRRNAHGCELHLCRSPI